MAEHPNSRLLSISDKAYHLLLYVYPAAHRREYGPWMAQLFRDLCRDAVQRDGAWGLVWLWARTLLDTARTALVEHGDDRKQVRGTRGSASAWESAMMDTTALDRQLGDLVYLLVKALRSGYSLRQCVAVVAETAPEPASSALHGWQADLEAGRTHEEALANLRVAWPSPYLAQIVETIKQNQEGDSIIQSCENARDHRFQFITNTHKCGFQSSHSHIQSLLGSATHFLKSTLK